MKIANSLTELMGNTPLLSMDKWSASMGVGTPVIAKVESAQYDFYQAMDLFHRMRDTPDNSRQKQTHRSCRAVSQDIQRGAFYLSAERNLHCFRAMETKSDTG